jgi:homopolymeric O-antigen transport system ATP-binding protein
MPESAIEVVNLSKCYKIYSRPVDRILDWVIPCSRKRYREFWALKQLSFAVQKGESLAIIGANGAGKSTLLKLISRTANPTRGYVNVRGRVAALLELGMGFHPEFTGRQNIRMNGKLLGLSDEELDEKVSDIIAFSELGDFIDQPIRTYSSGMYVRLGFSIVAAVEPDILIVDEALSVGDAHFQQKCIRRIREIHERNTTLLFVSHDPGSVKTLCNEAILIDEGEMIGRGEPDEILDHYNALSAKKNVRGASFHIERVSAGPSHIGIRHSGNFLAVITEAGICNDKNEQISAVVSGQEVDIFVKVFFIGEVHSPTFGFLIKDRLGNEIFGTNTYMLGKDLGICSAGETLDIRFSMKLDIGPGEYTLTAAAHSFESHLFECYDWVDKISVFSVIPSNDFKFTGVAKCYPELCIKKGDSSADQAGILLEQLFYDASSEISMGAASKKFLSKGWYDPETVHDGHIRWTDREFSFFLKVKGTILLLSLACPKTGIQSSRVSADVMANGVKIGSFIIDHPDYHTVSIKLPANFDGRLILFTVILDSTWKPSDFSENSDSRELGVMIQRIMTKE